MKVVCPPSAPSSNLERLGRTDSLCPGETLVALSNPSSIRIGVLAGEPMRLAGLSTVLQEAPESGRPQLISVVGTLPELLADTPLDYLVVDFNSSDEGMKTL